jgi:hypothetical protein
MASATPVDIAQPGYLAIRGAALGDKLASVDTPRVTHIKSEVS